MGVHLAVLFAGQLPPCVPGHRLGLNTADVTPGGLKGRMCYAYMKFDHLRQAFWEWYETSTFIGPLKPLSALGHDLAVTASLGARWLHQ